MEAKRQLNKDIRWQLENLRRSSATGQLRIRTSRQSLDIAVPGDLRSCQPIDDFVRMKPQTLRPVCNAGNGGIKLSQ